MRDEQERGDQRVDRFAVDEKIDAIKIARNQILNEYNIFNLMSKMANSKSNTNKKIKLRTNYYYSDSWLKKILRYALLLFRR